MMKATHWFSIVFMVIGWSACGGETNPADTTNEWVGGKADGTEECPAEVGINSGAGLQRRCYDLATGRFVPTVCCQDLCTGADWRMQGNGTRCAWVEEPGLEGAQLAQFAPRMCCELNDRLACLRGVMVDSECVDPENPLKVLPGVCCGQEEAGCHPEILWYLRGCAWELIEETAEDPLSGPLTPMEAVEQCFAEGNFPQECLDELRSEYDCVFGLTYHDIFKASSRLVVAAKRILTEDDIPALLPIQQGQLLEAVQQAGYEDVYTVLDAISVVDEQTVFYHELWEGSNGRAYRSYEFGAGGNSYGAIFEFGTVNLAARIHDGDLYDGSEDSQAGCRIPLGPRWSDCQVDSDCSAGLSCVGKTEHPIKGEVGRCVDMDLGAEAGREECSAADPCPLEAGLICSGLTRSDTGFCRPAWMSRRFSSSSVVEIPDSDADGLAGEIFAYGLASVDEEVIIDLEIEHPDLSQLLITLNNPTGPDGSVEIVFDGSNPQHLAEFSEYYGWAHMSRPCFFSGDESVNGAWILRVIDRAQGNQGKLHGWDLLLRSNWD